MVARLFGQDSGFERRPPSGAGRVPRSLNDGRRIAGSKGSCRARTATGIRASGEASVERSAVSDQLSAVPVDTSSYCDRMHGREIRQRIGNEDVSSRGESMKRAAIGNQLQRYRWKRDFGRTPEPSGRPKRMSCASWRVRGEKPWVPTCNDSSRFVFPAPFAPTTSTRPGSRSRSSRAYDLMFRRETVWTITKASRCDADRRGRAGLARAPVCLANVPSLSPPTLSL